MTLFGGRRLSRESVEARLNRRLTGDPTRGEVATLLAVNRQDRGAARRHLSTSDIGDDFRRLVDAHIARPAPREGTLKYISVGIPLQAWEEYANEARRTGRRPSECLADAIERDRRARAEVADVRGGLERTTREFIEAARQILDELRRPYRSP